jgi:hypothetical protein
MHGAGLVGRFFLRTNQPSSARLLNPEFAKDARGKRFLAARKLRISRVIPHLVSVEFNLFWSLIPKSHMGLAKLDLRPVSVAPTVCVRNVTS